MARGLADSAGVSRGSGLDAGNGRALIPAAAATPAVVVVVVQVVVIVVV